MALTDCHSDEGQFLNGTAQAAPGQPTATTQCVLWLLGRKEVTVDFSAEQVVSDTGLLIIRKLDRELGSFRRPRRDSTDPREQKYVVHDAERLLVQQVYQLLGVEALEGIVPVLRAAWARCRNRGHARGASSPKCEVIE